MRKVFGEIKISLNKIERENQIISHGFYEGRRIRWSFSFDNFYVKKGKIVALKKNLKDAVFTKI